MTTKLDTIYQAVSALNKREKREFLRRIADMPEFAEDLHDIATYLERKDLPTRPYEEFEKELKAEGKL